MRKLLLLMVLGVLASMTQPARAQFCPGVSPWVFDDVQASDPFCGNITWMAQHGITLGCQVIDANHRLYCPTANVSRSQMAAFMNRLGKVVHMQGGNAFGATAVLGTTDNNEIDLLANNSVVLRLQPGGGTSPNVAAGHAGNGVVAFGNGQTIGGGGKAGTDCHNPITGTDTRSCNNVVNFDFATVGGGLANTGGSWASFVGGGQSNVANGMWSTVPGGTRNVASGMFAAVLGGSSNTASGASSVAAGEYAHADHDGCFVYGGWSTFPNAGPSCLGTSNVVRFMVDHGLSVDYLSARADGGGNRWVYIGDLVPGRAINTWGGAYLSDPGTPNSGQWVSVSDVAGKTDFAALDHQDVLDRVAQMPIMRWRYKGEPEWKSHIGPTAQDFYAAFGLGDDDRHIGTIDEGGVALAAIQGLNAKLEAKVAEQAREIAGLKSSHAMEIAELKRAVEVLLARMSADGRVASR